MARTRAVTSRRAARSSDDIALVQAAQRMVGQIEALVDEIAALREDNDVLRR